MAAPTSITQYAAGASGHNDNVAIGTFTQDGQAAEETLWIHIGFVPKVFFLMNETSDGVFMWINSMPAPSGIDLVSTTSAYLDTEGFIGVDCSTTNIAPDATGAGPPGTYLYDYVPADEVYLKEGVAYTSGAYSRDEIIGIKIVDGGGDANVLGTTEDKFHYIAIR